MLVCSLRAKHGNDWAAIGTALGRSASSVKDKCRLMKDNCNSGGVDSTVTVCVCVCVCVCVHACMCMRERGREPRFFQNQTCYSVVCVCVCVRERESQDSFRIGHLLFWK